VYSVCGPVERTDTPERFCASFAKNDHQLCGLGFIRCLVFVLTFNGANMKNDFLVPVCMPFVGLH
jgi:hypothetical protein